MPIEVGDEFVDFKAFKADWSITGEHKFTFRYQKSDKTRNIAVCAHADCSFRVYAAMNRNRGMVEVITANPNHIRVGAVMQPRSTANRQAWLQRILPATLTVTKKTTSSEIIDAVKLHHQVSITHTATKRAKKSFLGDDLESQAMQFRLLPAYVDAVRAADPQSHVRLSVEDREGTCRFQRLFICPGIGHGTFRHCRPFIAMDGTFTKETFNLTILLAVSVDANNHSVLLGQLWRVRMKAPGDSFYPTFALQFQKSTAPQRPS